MAVSQLHHIKNSSGQTIVEFALVVSLLLAVLFGIVEFGRLWWYSNHLSNSVRAAARYGVVDSTATDLSDDIRKYLRGELNGFLPNAASIPDSSITVKIFPTPSTVRVNPTSAKRGDTLEVTVVYNFQVLSGGMIPYFSGPHPLVRSASMLYEGR